MAKKTQLLKNGPQGSAEESFPVSSGRWPTSPGMRPTPATLTRNTFVSSTYGFDVLISLEASSNIRAADAAWHDAAHAAER